MAELFSPGGQEKVSFGVRAGRVVDTVKNHGRAAISVATLGVTIPTAAFGFHVPSFGSGHDSQGKYPTAVCGPSTLV